MFLYLELLNVRLYFCHTNPEVLERLNIFWTLYTDYCEISNEVTREYDWLIDCKRSKKEFISINYPQHYILFVYSTQYDYLEINSLIRELIVKLTVEKGVLWLHASSFSIGNKVFVVVGIKGHGKTTWMTIASKYLNARFICNDQLPIQIINGKPYTRKWRPDIKITQGTLDILGENIRENVDRYMIFENEKNDIMFDFYGFSKLTGQSIVPISKQISWDFKFESTNWKEVTNVILLNRKVNNFDRINLLDEFEKIKLDKECVIPSKAQKWNENFAYWNKRMTKLFIEKKHIDNETKDIEIFADSVTSIVVNNEHMEVKEVVDLICKLIDDNL